MLHTYGEVTRIDLRTDHNSVRVHVPVDVASESVQLSWVHGDMSQDQTVHNVAATYVSEIRRILFQTEDVVVSFDKDFVAIQPAKCTQRFAVNDNIAEMVHFVVRANSLVPTTNHLFVHIIWVIPRTEFCHPICLHKLTHPMMTEVCVTCQKYCWHVSSFLFGGTRRYRSPTGFPIQLFSRQCLVPLESCSVEEDKRVEL